MKMLFIILIINLFNVYYVRAQNVEFSLKKLEDIASQLPPVYLTGNDTIMSCPDICKNKSIVILHNKKRQISHLGLSLFSKETKEIINPSICDFIERLMLELALEKDNNSIISMLDRNKIIIKKNGVDFGDNNVTSINAILDEIKEPVIFSLNKNDLDSYTAAWEYGNDNVLLIHFPSNRELILGINKKESDNILHGQLIENYCTDANEKNIFIKKENIPASSYNPSIYVFKGDTFMLGEISEDTYYKKSANGYELIFDKGYPKESLSNLFYWQYGNNNLKIHVKHSMYGNFSPEYEMKFADFICFFKNDFKIFTASRLQESGELNTTVIFQNKQYNYIHLLIINTSEECIFEENGVMSASFYSNIPQHNIKNIVGDLIKKD